jgi:hypothetical protein
MGLAERVRLEVYVEADKWIEGELPGFPVRYLEPTGRAGTEIVLRGVRARLRRDRILRHLQRLPLGDNFNMWRNGEFVPPRQWTGIDHIDVDVMANWGEGGEEHSGRVRGEIWLRPEPQSGRDSAYIKEPDDEKSGLAKDPAGVEVKVDGDVIIREFFGHAHHGHQVNRIWGWVEAPWLPILANRTDYIRDSPAGIAFQRAVKPLYEQAYKRIRYEQDRREQQRRRERLLGGAAEAAAGSSGEGGGRKAGGEVPRGSASVDDSLASRYGEVLNQIMQDKPELAPVLRSEPKLSPGRPAKDRIYPVRPTGQRGPFQPDIYGADLALAEDETLQRVARAIQGNAKRLAQGQAADAELAVQVTNTTAGVRLRFSALGTLEGPYRWTLDQVDELTLDINVDHPLYRQAAAMRGAIHRLHCAWLVSLALAEASNPIGGRRLVDYLEDMTFELFSRWAQRRPSEE